MSFNLKVMLLLMLAVIKKPASSITSTTSRSFWVRSMAFNRLVILLPAA
ncbi:hypothetical protein [Methanocella conradii]|nr:hypothetical protein [Methanocella conradii]MDI6897308.1 hypothetical protein [Methanocella conradii]